MDIKDLTKQQIEDIAESVAGGCQDHFGIGILDELGIDAFALDEICAMVEVYKCPNCCWWGHQGEVLEHINSNGEAVCEDCGEEEED